MDLSIASRDQVLNKLNSDDATGAIRLARELLLNDPDNSDVLGLLGNALKAAGDFAGGADALRRALSLPATASIKLRNTANLAALLIASAQTSEAVELLDTAWEWVVNAELRANERRCVTLIGEIMTHLELTPALVALHLPLVEGSQHDWPILRQALLALSVLGRADEALRLAAAHNRAHPDETECQAVLAYLYHRMGRTEDAETLRAEYLSSAPPYIAPAQPEQAFTIGVINPAPPYEDLIKSVGYRHFKTNFPHQLERKLGDRYRFVSILKGSGPSAIDELCEHSPKAVINNIAVAEGLLTGNNRDEVEQLALSIGAPVINPARQISLCTRQMNFERFSKLPNVVTPLLKRFTLDLSHLGDLQAMIEQSFAYPLIVRTTGDNDGKGMVRIDSGPALRQTLLNLRRQQIYVIQFVDTTHYGKYYRKLRAAFVGGAPTVMRADYDHNWIVLGRKKTGRREFYQEHPHLLADANDIVTRPLERLGAPALAALDAIGRLMPLDIFGLDFDVDDHGAIVFFEANASMNLFGRALPEFPFPPIADATLMERMEAFLQRKANAGQA
jgi:Flp pilus assembly protein TadD